MQTSPRISLRLSAMSLGFSAALLSTPALAAEPQSCQTVRFADVGWAPHPMNSKFNLDKENAIMSAILDKKQKPEAAARAWIKANPSVWGTWLRGVKTFDGKMPNVAKFTK